MPTIIRSIAAAGAAMALVIAPAAHGRDSL